MSKSQLRVGIDAVSVQAIQASIETFGDRFVHRIFTPHEIATANASPARLAARFAAKEAAIKVFDLSEAGVAWRDIELHSDPAGRPKLRLRAKALAAANAIGPMDIAVSLSHEEGMAFAVVVAMPALQRESQPLQ